MILHKPRHASRNQWLETRLALEVTQLFEEAPGKKRRERGLFGDILAFCFRWLNALGLTKYLKGTTLNLVREEFEVKIPNLPNDFDGYTILHLTDLHFDIVPEVLDAIISNLPNKPVDLAVFTGDYQEDEGAEPHETLTPLSAILRNLKTRDGALATLGNHDRAWMAEAFEGLGINVLNNESMEIKRGTSSLTITGLDDVHFYKTEQSEKALTESGTKCKIALVHSSEMAEEASRNGYSLYLAGHSHGGQIRLPVIGPIITHTMIGRQYAAGVLHHKGAVCCISRGVKASRFFFARLLCPPEAIAMTIRPNLRRHPARKSP